MSAENDEQPESLERRIFTVTHEASGERLDKALAVQHQDCSRTYIKCLIEQGRVTIDGAVSKAPSQKVEEGTEIVIYMPEPEETAIDPEDIPLNIVFEDEDLLVINKPAGMVVHPGAGNYTHTLVNALLYHCRDDLSGIGGSARPGIVHRIDKDTSGLIIVAKNDKAHRKLSAQLASRTLSRKYICLVLGVPVPPAGTIDRPLGRHRTDRLKMAVKPGGREAVTDYTVIKQKNNSFALTRCSLRTGRTHQIRVHMQAIKNPIIGDPLYGPQHTALLAAIKRAGLTDEAGKLLVSLERQALHAEQLSFVHPSSSEEMNFKAPLPEDIENIAKIIFR
jgi:23S rRNA pseudouridine1911/1915/1917 synthase